MYHPNLFELAQMLAHEKRIIAFYVQQEERARNAQEWRESRRWEMIHQNNAAAIREALAGDQDGNSQ